MQGTTEYVGVPTAKSLDGYRRAKLQILKRDFYIKLTDEELAHAKELTSEIAIDQFCLSAIARRWDK